MFLKENMLLALESLRANKMRAFLTMLGIIIGIASVIAIISVGNSLSSSITSQLQGMGTNNFMLNIREKGSEFQGPKGRGKDGPSGSGGATAEDKDLITKEMVEAFQERFKDKVEAISLSESVGTGQAKDGRLYANVSVSGVNPGYMTVNSVEMTNGRFINDSDMAGRKSVTVVSDKLVKNIFGDSVNPVGKEVKFYGADGIKTYIVVGTYKYKESSMFSAASTSSEKDIQTSMYVPITLAKQDKTIKNYSNVTIMSKSDVNADDFKSSIESFFSKYYEKNAKWEPSVFSMSSQIEMASSMMSTVSIAIAVIAAISLLVGGIGVMNIMLVSVTERTREIGTRKALGAKNFHIRMQFITEAMIISLVGGLIGLILGILLGILGSTLMGASPSFSVPVVILTVAFSMAIGVFFGYYPANKAAQLDPIDALRYE
ncbi:ABC transporter permease [Clostridium magnum]|uniref:ABC transporter permease n=1 Tax=Clostridium magnum TaxID=33954 RepID=UPI00091D341C|nr:ABC transporter permease [Clostridium magnum]SHI96515.1 putative ABC transport system permease protein [Clostridium magnum DSM 2767]